jgi:hypothetical protein
MSHHPSQTPHSSHHQQSQPPLDLKQNQVSNRNHQSQTPISNTYLEHLKHQYQTASQTQGSNTITLQHLKYQSQTAFQTNITIS